MPAPSVPPVPSAQESEFLERMGLFFEQVGGPRTMGRIFGWLMICEAQAQSITELATAVGASKASVSTVVRQLAQAQMIERVPAAGSRQHIYRLKPGGWTQVIQARLSRLRLGVETAEYGLSVIAQGPSPQRERLVDMRDYFSFVAQEFGVEIIHRWEDHKRKREA